MNLRLRYILGVFVYAALGTGRVLKGPQAFDSSQLAAPTAAWMLQSAQNCTVVLSSSVALQLQSVICTETVAVLRLYGSRWLVSSRAGTSLLLVSSDVGEAEKPRADCTRFGSFSASMPALSRDIAFSSSMAMGASCTASTGTYCRCGAVPKPEVNSASDPWLSWSISLSSNQAFIWLPRQDHGLTTSSGKHIAALVFDLDSWRWPKLSTLSSESTPKQLASLFTPAGILQVPDNEKSSFLQFPDGLSGSASPLNRAVFTASRCSVAMTWSVHNSAPWLGENCASEAIWHWSVVSPACSARQASFQALVPSDTIQAQSPLWANVTAQALIQANHERLAAEWEAAMPPPMASGSLGVLPGVSLQYPVTTTAPPAGIQATHLRLRRIELPDNPAIASTGCSSVPVDSWRCGWSAVSLGIGGVGGTDPLVSGATSAANQGTAEVLVAQHPYNTTHLFVGVLDKPASDNDAVVVPVPLMQTGSSTTPHTAAPPSGDRLCVPVQDDMILPITWSTTEGGGSLSIRYGPRWFEVGVLVQASSQPAAAWNTSVLSLMWTYDPRVVEGGMVKTLRAPDWSKQTVPSTDPTVQLMVLTNDPSSPLASGVRMMTINSTCFGSTVSCSTISIPIDTFDPVLAQSHQAIQLLDEASCAVLSTTPRRMWVLTQQQVMGIRWTDPPLSLPVTSVDMAPPTAFSAADRTPSYSHMTVGDVPGLISRVGASACGNLQTSFATRLIRTTNTGTGTGSMEVVVLGAPAALSTSSSETGQGVTGRILAGMASSLDAEAITFRSLPVPADLPAAYAPFFGELTAISGAIGNNEQSWIGHGAAFVYGGAPLQADVKYPSYGSAGGVDVIVVANAQISTALPSMLGVCRYIERVDSDASEELSLVAPFLPITAGAGQQVDAVTVSDWVPVQSSAAAIQSGQRLTVVLGLTNGLVLTVCLDRIDSTGTLQWASCEWPAMDVRSSCVAAWNQTYLLDSAISGSSCVQPLRTPSEDTGVSTTAVVLRCGCESGGLCPATLSVSPAAELLAVGCPFDPPLTTGVAESVTGQVFVFQSDVMKEVLTAVDVYPFTAISSGGYHLVQRLRTPTDVSNRPDIIAASQYVLI